MVALFPGPSVGNPLGDGTYFNFAAANAGQQIKTGDGSLRYVVVGTNASTATITLYDGTSTSAPMITSINAANCVTLPFECAFTTGLFAVVTAGGAVNITVIYA